MAVGSGGPLGARPSPTCQPIDDDRLPQLRLALDPHAMAQKCGVLFPHDYPDRELDVKNCEILRVYHKPGKACRVVYRVDGRGAHDIPFDKVFWVQITADPTKTAKLDHSAPDAWPGCKPFKPVSPCPPILASLHAFPYDRKLPHLGPLADTEHVRTLVNARLGALQLDSTWTCRGVDFQIAKYMPEARCVLRYDLEMAGPDGSRCTRRIFGKTYKNATSRYVFDALLAICSSLSGDETDLNVPRPIAHLDLHHTFWQESWEGETLAARAARLGWTTLLQDGAGKLMTRVGRSLARLHAVPPPPLLKPGESPHAILGNAAGDAADILDFLPERRGLLKQQFIDTLRATAPTPDDLHTRALIHGTFKTAQILCRDDEIAIVDFDSVALGDPLYDVAEFVASLAFLRIKEAVPAPAAERGAASFIRAYESATPWACDRRRIAWYVVAFLLGKIHSSLKKHRTHGSADVLPALRIASGWLAVANGQRKEWGPEAFHGESLSR